MATEPLSSPVEDSSLFPELPPVEPHAVSSAVDSASDRKIKIPFFIEILLFIFLHFCLMQLFGMVTVYLISCEIRYPVQVKSV